LLFAFVTLLVARPSVGAQQVSSGRAPRIFIEGYRSMDSLSLRAASMLRAAVARRVAPSSLEVMTTEAIENHRAAGAPDDFGGAWNWALVRESGWAYGADAVVDVTAIQTAGGIKLQTWRLRPPKAGKIVELPVVHASSLDRAVEELARRLVADAILRQAPGEPQPSRPPA
jgi:hypothetical protein